MKRFFIFAAAVFMFAALSGCNKQQEAEDLQPVTLESLSVSSSQAPAMPQDVNLPVVSDAGVKELMPLPPSGPYKPSEIEIQTALKNAGFYAGSIDGKIGPKSKKAIEDFQSANGLKVDGKVGAKTWEVLGKYLSVASNIDKR
jgi:peptidoglycan hydrolase-like protein with peptidoglycan-binding domain